MTERPLTPAERAYLDHRAGGMLPSDWLVVADRCVLVVVAAIALLYACGVIR